MRLVVGLTLMTGCEAERIRPAIPPQAKVRLPVTLFGLPVEDRLRISARVGVDHDPKDRTGLVGDSTCRDYIGRSFPWCYDQHTGTDLILAGGFDAMDAGSMAIVAAYDGVVIETEDGNYDRCHVSGTSVTCDGYPIRPNYVALRHADGLVSWYYHLATDSLMVEVGDRVRCGDPLALIGSSGNSSMPHVHFEVTDGADPDAEVIDPFAGPWSQPESLWEEQGPDNGLPGDGCTR